MLASNLDRTYPPTLAGRERAERHPAEECACGPVRTWPHPAVPGSQVFIQDLEYA